MRKLDIANCVVSSMLVYGGLATPLTAIAQIAASGSDGTLEEVVITATKVKNGVSVHDAPIAVSAFSENQLESAHVEQISDLSDFVPNVFLNTSSTVAAVNNLTIRGMGVYSSIPSSTPTVGVFVDGVYLGATAGTSLNSFDYGGIEVLRGPQGLLFGRNVTAGAVLVNTTDPTDDFHVRLRASVESDPNFTESAVVTGPLVSGVVDGKLAVYRNDDAGYFRNLYDNNGHFGENRSTIARGALTFFPDDPLSTTIKLEYGHMDGDGPAGQNHGAIPPTSFNIDINTPGFQKNDWLQVIYTTKWAVGVGDGQVLNIMAWRRVDESGLTDADSTPETYFDFGQVMQQHQFSDELRYSGTLGRVTPTAGLFFYTDHLNYIEYRDLSLGTLNIIGGGQQDSTTYAGFGNFDVAMTQSLTLNLGGRYSSESKTAQVQDIALVATSPCSLPAKTCSSYDFRGSHTWYAFTPKVGLDWKPGRDTNAYLFWTKGFRSGGYNLRQTVLSSPPGPYNQEVEDTYEAGIKQNAMDGRLKANFAIFENHFNNLQRDVLFTDPVLGTVQTTVNTADVTIRGIEGEVNYAVSPRITVSGNFGYLESKFDRIFYNLLGSGPVTPADYGLALPFLSPWSYGGAVTYNYPTRFGNLDMRADFEHRDRSATNDANTDWLATVNDLGADLSLKTKSGFIYSLYGKNLLNNVTYGLNTPLPFLPNETFSPLNKGRVVGVEVRYEL